MACPGFAQVPQKLSYQAVIRDALGALITNTQVGIRISIIRGPLPGTLAYQEIQTPVTNENGLVTLEIGGENGFDAISWGSEVHYIKTETDPDGGTNYTISSISQMLSVPYAFFAGKAQAICGRFCYPDKDGDGSGDAYSPLWIPEDINVPTGFILNGEDCNDLDPSVHPGATEICGDGIDQDCDELVDETC
ncbi:MAG: putative metal-binding motif-containing protein [Bacteroidia bacterium]|nr:putative metal-binding motif-containing protein [Bacteroidia bacterium]